MMALLSWTIECTLTSFSGDIKLEEMTNRTKGRVAIWMDLSPLEEWADTT